MSKHFFALIFLINLSSFLSLHGQNAPNGSISGVVFDKTENVALEYVTVALFKQKETKPLKGTTTNAKGEFKLELLPNGEYRIEVSYLGYQKLVVNNNKLSTSNPKIDLKTLFLVADDQLLKEVEIKGELNINQYSIDKKVYNPSKDLVVKGGNAIDALQNIPSIQVDAENNIQFRGSSNVTIFIDGKPSNLGGDRSAVLAQIPAENIERIEIISNPSARYDAEGSGGIINIITKKGAGKQSSGQFNLNIGTNDKYQGNLLYFHQKGKWQFSTSYGFNQDNRWSRNASNRDLLNEDISRLNQTGRDFDLRNSHNLRLNADYNFNPNNSFYLSGGVNLGLNQEKELMNYRFSRVIPSITLDSFGYRNANTANNNLNGDISGGWKHQFKQKKGATFNMDFSYSYADDQERMNAKQEFYTESWQLVRPTVLQNTNRIRSNHLGTFQGDLIWPLAEKSKLEAGFKSVVREIDNSFASESFDPPSESFLNDVGLTNRFIYTEQVYAAYASYTGAKGRWGYSGGLRFEQTFSYARQITIAQFNENHYPGLFPSVFLNYKVKEGQDLQVNYSRRINRPTAGQLNPFANFTDPYHLRSGNPLLQPEYINSFELGYARITKKLTFSTTIYSRTTVQQITRFRRVDSLGVSTTTFENMDRGHSLGIEGVTQFSIVKWWRVNANVNISYVNLSAGRLTEGLQNTNWGGNFRISNSFSLVKGINAQLAYNFFQPPWALQGNIRPFHSADIGLQKELWKGRGSIGFRLTDLFDTRQFQIDLQGQGFVQDNLWKSETRIGYLNFTYKLGNQKANVTRKRGREGGVDGGGMDDF